MPCNCGSKGGAVTYLYTAPDGTSKYYNTEIEAAAAKVRNGGGTVTAVAK